MENVTIEATTEREDEVVEEYAGPLVDHPINEMPTRVLSRPPTEAEDEIEIWRMSMPQPDQEMTNGSKGRDQSADGSHLTKKDQRSAGTPSAIYTIKEIVYANRGQDRPSETIEDVKVTATEEIRYVVANPLHKRSSYQPDAISIEDGKLKEQVDRLVEND